MDIRCPQCGAAIPLGDHTLLGAEMLCCLQCQGEIRIQLDAAPAQPVTAKRPTHRVRVSPQDLTALAAPPADERPAVARSGRRAGWLLADLVLLLLLALQVAYFLRDDLAQRPALRPWLERLCAVAGCTLPLQRDLDRIEVVARHLRPHPEVPDGLVVTITILNRAPFPQPYPVLDLRFYDLEDRIVAGRRFPPRLYLPPGLDPDRGLAPDTPLPIVLELVDPGEQAVNFRFDFL